MKNQTRNLKNAFDGLLWLSAESLGTRFFVDVSLWASRQEIKVEIVDLLQGATPIFMDSSYGNAFDTETINAMEDRLIEKLGDLKAQEEQAA
ncbi:hypothetical protein [Grimontia marina]|uniref:Uncharacterized protein n=1 Tax=Grimontia marina TaxID=646534 RepID=A0A128F9G9_9GAMM|nr:hypothetical protein [Grimontia marina]CZF83155.1 hypothetical protein GMA8713_02503 [Grimontia marina]